MPGNNCGGGALVLVQGDRLGGMEPSVRVIASFLRINLINI